MSSGFYVGMQGPGAAIAHDVPDPVNRATGATVDIMSATSKVLSVTYRFADGSSKTITSWSLASVSSDLVRGTYIPSSNDFTTPGPMKVETQIMLDGVLYQYADTIGNVDRRPGR